MISEMVPLLSPASSSPGQMPFRGGTNCARVARDWCAWCQMLRENLYDNYWGEQLLNWAFIFSRRTQKAHWQGVLPSWLIPRFQPASWASWPCNVSLAIWALSRISVQYKWIWWADLRLFHVPLVLDHYRLLFQVLWFLAAATGFLTLASALFLPLKLSNWLHMQSNPIHSWQSFKLFIANLSLKIRLLVSVWRRMKIDTSLIAKEGLK